MRISVMQSTSIIIRGIVAVIGIAIVSGCGTSLKTSNVRPSVSPTAIVQVNQRLEIPSGKKHVYIQDGVVIALRNKDEWSTYCSLLVQQKNATGETKPSISPGQFEIVKVIEYEDYTGTQRTYVASLGWFFDVSSKRPVNVVFGVEIRLKSAEQPGVRSLTCEKRSDSYSLYDYPTLAEIKTALGDTIEIKSR